MDTPIKCADCGEPYTAKRRNAKYCRLCRLFRDLIYLDRRTHECVSCGDRFAPLHSNDKLCAICDFATKTADAKKCSFCSEKRATVNAEVSVCLGCAKDPKHRRLLIQATGKKRRTRTEANADG